ncbi:hypothetical protein FHK02_3202 [Spirosoma sp. LMG 31448]|uniref:Uncharacterized protein n=1 Tax=Spirosoma utsteinense TaxID=2585773 RepID=A0ABR6W5J6_9BACT|nr:hypothetical protein [Spirosoma utsteinense]MBC3791065.1 hypothetical protein [Spirosoma utsteinense]
MKTIVRKISKYAEFNGTLFAIPRNEESSEMASKITLIRRFLVPRNDKSLNKKI